MRTDELSADIRTADPGAVEPVLRRLVDADSIATQDGFHVAATLTGARARDRNRTLLSALRKAQPRTSLGASWTCAGVTERCVDSVPKGPRSTAQ